MAPTVAIAIADVNKSAVSKAQKKTKIKSLKGKEMWSYDC